jgi:hypothetical protein
MNITWPTTQEKEVVDAIRNAIGRDVDFYYVASSIPCTEPGCSLDPVTSTSTNSFCIVCSGWYYIPQYQVETIKAHVSWGYAERLGWVTGGTLDEGECRLQIENTPGNITILNSTKWIMVDDRKMQIINRLPRGVQTINRILIDLIEKENNGG